MDEGEVEVEEEIEEERERGEDWARVVRKKWLLKQKKRV